MTNSPDRPRLPGYPKRSPREAAVMARMAPGVLSMHGFLGDDPRSLNEIIDADAAELERLGLPRDAVADRLAELRDAAVDGLGSDVQIGDGVTAAHREAMGRLPCPFGGCGVFPKGEVVVTLPDGNVLRFTALSIHMIREHGFFEGRGSRYRVEPAVVARLIG
jgi:hypothetical protein